MTATSPSSAAAPRPSRVAGRASFGRAAAAEWGKLRSTRSTYWTLLSGFAVSVGFSALLASIVSSGYDDLSARAKADFDPAYQGLQGLGYALVAFGVLGVLTITSEYSGGLIRVSLAAVPRRGRLLAAKAAVLGGLVLVVGEVSSAVSFAVSQAIFAAKGADARLGDPGMLRAVLGGGLYIAVITLLSLALGVIVRRSAGALTVVLTVLFVLPAVGAFLPGSAGETYNNLLPANAGQAIMAVRPQDGSLGPWAGFGVLCLYTAVLMAVAWGSFQRRDA
ncbi:ABC transporter permease subunit [Streptomyces sp. TS71-3]|uniref:ABC transporter permease subunit n=1 Tax=Streptomyces sp. TS71-3 TaxID=2733862 RepID=UPI001B060D6F|nr:ABC transporter permease subunit [Streptomyces sp. TS71-3]GHJ39528.1 ABC transporter permease [Streptomyces sp. TS71-3]